MNAWRTPSVSLALGMCGGIVTARLFQPESLPDFATLLGTTLILLSIAWILKHRWPPPAFPGLAVLAFYCFGGWVATGRMPEKQPGHYVHADWETPALWQIRLGEPLRPTAFYQRWEGSVVARDGKPCHGRILLQVPVSNTLAKWEPAATLLAYGKPEAVPPARNPHQFDFAAYLRTRGIHGRFRPDAGSRVLPANPRGAGSLGRTVARLRHRLIESLGAAGFHPEVAGLIRALILGDRSGLDQDLYGAYQRAGAVHLLAVSGLHVGLVAALCSWLLWPLRRLPGGRRPHFLLGLGMLWGYAALAGFGPSVVRASVMCSVVSYALLINRQADSLHFLALAALVMLGLIEPLWLFQAGFQMSFLAVWAILSLYPWLYRSWPVKRGAGRKIGQLLCVSGAAQLGVLPLSLYYFHQFPALFWLSNLLLIPVMGVVLASGFLLLGLASYSPLPDWVAWGADRFFGLFNGVVRWVGGQEGFLITEIPWDGVQLALSLAALVALGTWARSRDLRWLKRTGALLLALQVYSVGAGWHSGRQQEWLIPHRFGESALILRQGAQARIFSNNLKAWEGFLSDFSTGERLRQVLGDSLCPQFQIGRLRLRVVDSTGRYQGTGAPPHIVLLTGSPAVRPGQLLDDLQPRQVIADGSNYRSTINRWEASCRKRGIPFHNTALHGAYRSAIP
ncbi:ComEC/Rec2 family competence protein [Robiginitalea biformata]|uniref:ComEC/Rec2 family competence protein n=1 Tax=Robiginitalea biformata TaxID=252307 RepID=UPI003BAA7916